MARILRTEFERRESCIETEARDLQRVPLKHSTGNFIRTCLSENNPRLGEKPSERISGDSAWHSHRARNSVCSNEPDWKLTIHGTLGKALRKAFASLGNN